MVSARWRSLARASKYNTDARRSSLGIQHSFSFFLVRRERKIVIRFRQIYLFIYVLLLFSSALRPTRSVQAQVMLYTRRISIAILLNLSL